MADRLTQLQDCLDDVRLLPLYYHICHSDHIPQLLVLMYSSMNYIRTHHPYGEIPGQPSQAPAPLPQPTPTSATVAQSSFTNGATASQQPVQAQAPANRDGSPPPDDRPTFNAALHEMARDIVVKEQQVEYLINSLPGIGSSEADQERRMRELEVELREVEKERAEVEREREALVDGLGKVIVGVRRVP